MSLFLNGVWLGLALSILVGPILFALIQTSIEQGFRAGAMVGLGIWISDMLFITISYSSMASVVAITEWQGFNEGLGIIGGLVLMGFGVGTIWLRPPSIKQLRHSGIRSTSYFQLWLKGFLINTLNPFTLFFWISVTSTIIVAGELNTSEASLFYSGLLGTVILTDTAKVALAKFIRRWMKPHYILNLRRLSGAALVLFGIVLIVRVLIT